MRSYVFTNAEGRQDYMGSEEVEAIERSGTSSIGEYITTPPTWPQATTPFTPLMEQRPGATEPQMPCPWMNGVTWTYKEVLDLMRMDIEKFCRSYGRQYVAAKMKRAHVEDQIRRKKLKWDGGLLLRGSKASMVQWPIGMLSDQRRLLQRLGR